MKQRLPSMYLSPDYYRQAVIKLPLSDYDKVKLLFNAGFRGRALVW